jgi:transposase-like protein
MSENNVVSLRQKDEIDDPLTEILRCGAKRLIEEAVADFAIATFAEKYAPKYDKAVGCLLKDRDVLLTFFDFPAEHWTYLRTSNPIESAFATVRHRTVRMKGALSQDTARLMVSKLVMAASKSWRRLQGQNQLPKVVSGVTFRYGIEVASEKKSAA